MLVRKLRDDLWDIVGDVDLPGLYESLATAARAIELTDDEKRQVLTEAAIRGGSYGVVTYAEVIRAIANRHPI
jgi:hypothetical protein